MSLHTEVSYSHFVQCFVEGLCFLHLLLVALWQVFQGLGEQGSVVLFEPSTVDHSFVNTLPASGLSPLRKYFGFPRQHAL